MDHIPELCPTRRREYWRAARSGNFNMLEKGISLFHLDAGRNSLLHVAAQLGHLEFAEEAVKQEPSLLTRQNIYGDTPLHCAARVGYHDIVEAFISKSLSLPAESKGGKASLEMVNKVGNTALHEAAANGHKHVVAVLLTKAPALSATNNSINGVSPLYMAVESQSAPTVQLLLDQEGASYDGPNEQTALHPAVLISYKITRLLLEKRPMLLQKTDACGSSPLHFAASKNDVLVVKLLVETDESIAYLQDNEGVSPLHVAATCGHVEIIDYLIARCPDCVNLVDNLGRIFFHVAIELKRVGVTKYMVDRSRALIDPLNKPNGEGNTPLHLAVLSPHKDIINMLVTNKHVKTNAMNNKGQTPLDLVFDEEDDEVVQKNNCSKCSEIKDDEEGFSKEFKDEKERLQKLHITSALLGGGSRFSNRRFDNIACHLRKLESEVNVDKHMINSVSIVAILIATVTFAAAFTLPGGYKSDQSKDPGMAMLTNTIFFKVFLILDSLAMTLSITVLLILIPLSWKSSAEQFFKFKISIVLLQFSVLAFVYAFIAGIYAVILRECSWLAGIIGVLVVYIAGVSILSLTDFYQSIHNYAGKFRDAYDVMTLHSVLYHLQSHYLYNSFPRRIHWTSLTLCKVLRINRET